MSTLEPIILQETDLEVITPFYLRFVAQQKTADEAVADLRLWERALILVMKEKTGVDLSDGTYAFNPDRGVLLPIEGEAAS